MQSIPSKSMAGFYSEKWKKNAIKLNYIQNVKLLERTKSDKYGTIIKATPAATLQAPTPAFRIAVGYNSAVYTGITVFPALIVNFPIKQNNLKFKKIHSKIIFKWKKKIFECLTHPTSKK